MTSTLLQRLSGALGLGAWSRAELGAALAVAVVLVVPITSKVGYSGAWDGDPSTHNRLVVDAVNTIADEHAKGGDPLRGLLQCYYVFPKMLHEVMLTGFVLLLNGVRHVSFGEVERYAAWFATLWTLGGFLVLYHFLRLFFSRLESLAVLPVACLSGYILMYANFPRQNMPSHVLCWLALLIFARARLQREASAPGALLASGAFFGAAVAVHYSATYMFFGLLGVEAVRFLRDRRVVDSVVAVALSFSGAAAVWFLIDLFYFVYANRYPHDTNFYNQTIREHHSFLEGMVNTARFLGDEGPNFKLEPTHWWFLPGLIYRSFGPVGAALVAVGAAGLPSAWRRAPDGGRRVLVAALAALLLVCAAVSLGYFQNARKLMPFFPAWCVLLGYGLLATAHGLRFLVRRFGVPRGAPLASALAPYVLVVMAAHFAAFGPALARVYACRRDSGYMREYLAAHGIGRILVVPITVDSQMAPVQTDLRSLTLDEADKFDYVVMHRLIAKVYTEKTMDELRPIKPLVAFDNQAATPLFWYEFPLKKPFMDTDDSLVHQRALYRWQDVRGVLARFCWQPKPSPPENEGHGN